MALGDQFQTIVYYEDTGDIREILPNQYIKSRKSLNSALGLSESKGIKFFYIPGYFPLQKDDWTVELGGRYKCPKLISRDGKDAALLLRQQEASYILKTHRGIEYKFEGGMGDYMDQADVVIEMHKKNPDKTFWALIEHENRKKAIEMLDGWEGIGWGAGGLANTQKLGRVNMSDITKIQGWAPIGKIGVYSAIGGLETTAAHAKVLVTAAERKEAEEVVRRYIKAKSPRLIILHTVSGPANTKSIPPRAVVKLLSSLLKNDDLYFLHIGGAGEEFIDHPQIISLQGILEWEKVFALMSIAQGCICIDSAIMHVAQHFPIPVISFWGPTIPIHIVGDNPGITTIRSTAKCRGCNLWDCDKGICMTQFEMEEVTAVFETLKGGL